MKEIVRITIGLTLSCLVAAMVMGGVFAVTDKAKKYNEHVNFEQTAYALLGYSKSNPIPPSLKLHTIYRYIIEDDQSQEVGYMVPVRRGGDTVYDLLIIDLKGDPVKITNLDIKPPQAAERAERDAALSKALGSSKRATYADSTIVAELDGKRLAYLLPGEFPGFKTFISVMLALDPSYDVLGLDITEHEEDPGLGGEITQPYFKNQFKGKEFESVRKLSVVKEPLPEDYRKILEGKTEGMSPGEVEAIRNNYQYKDIYALTGATISSRAVANGVRNMVEKFAYRMNILDKVLGQKDVAVAY